MLPDFTIRENCTDATDIMIMHDVLESPACENSLLGKSQMRCENFIWLLILSNARRHNSPLKVQKLHFLIFFTHSFAADVESLPGYRQEVLNELHIRAGVFFFHSRRDATAYKHLLMGTNVLCEKGQKILL